MAASSPRPAEAVDWSRTESFIGGRICYKRRWRGCERMTIMLPGNRVEPALAWQVGLTRDILDSRGEPAFGRAPLAILDEAPNLQWEYLPAVVPALDCDHAARY